MRIIPLLLTLNISGFYNCFAADNPGTNEVEEVGLAEGIFYFILRILLTMAASGLMTLAFYILVEIGKGIITLSGKVRDFFSQKK